MIRVGMMQLGLVMLAQGLVGGVIALFGGKQEWGLIYLIDRFLVDLPALPGWVTWAIAAVGLLLTIPWALLMVKPLWQAVVNGPGKSS